MGGGGGACIRSAEFLLVVFLFCLPAWGCSSPVCEREIRLKSSLFLPSLHLSLALELCLIMREEGRAFHC